MSSRPLLANRETDFSVFESRVHRLRTHWLDSIKVVLLRRNRYRLFGARVDAVAHARRLGLAGKAVGQGLHGVELVGLFLELQFHLRFLRIWVSPGRCRKTESI